MLTPTHIHKPGCPRNLTADTKVLSPTPTISFSKQGKDSHPGGVAVARINETEVTVVRAHPMRTCSQKEEISAIAQDALMSRLNSVIERSYHCIIKKPRKKTQPHPSRPKLGLSYGDPYKYLTYPETGISEQPALDINPFNIIGDGYLDDSDSDVNQDNSDATDQEQYFDFDDILPFLKEDDNDNPDLNGAFRRYKDEAGYHDEGEVHPPVQVPEPQVHDPALLRPETPPHQRHGWITTPRRWLPAEEADKPEGAVGGDVWEAPASLEAQMAFFSRLLDEIERYTAAAETTQRSVQALAPAAQQQVQVKLWRKAQHLRDQLLLLPWVTVTCRVAWTRWPLSVLQTTECEAFNDNDVENKEKVN